jgi:hypothetical protein
MNGSRLAGVVGCLPVPSAISVGGAKGAFHRRAQHRRIDALAALEMQKKKLRRLGNGARLRTSARTSFGQPRQGRRDVPQSANSAQQKMRRDTTSGPELLSLLFPGTAVTRFDAAHIDDHLDSSIKPSVALMNPPFSARRGLRQARYHHRDAADRNRSIARRGSNGISVASRRSVGRCHAAWLGHGVCSRNRRCARRPCKKLVENERRAVQFDQDGEWQTT